MTVVHIIAPAPMGGAESVVAALASARRESTAVIILHQGAAPDTPELPLTRVLRQAGVTVEEVRCGRRRYVAEALMSARVLKRMKASVVHTHGYHGNFVGWLAARVTGTPVVATAHGYLGRDTKERLFDAFDRFLLRRFDAAVAVSPGIRDLLEKRGVRPERLFLVQNGVAVSNSRLDPARAREELGLPADMPVVGWIGRLSFEKGADYFVRATAALSSRCCVVLVGDGMERAMLEGLAADLHVGGDTGKLRFAGFREAAAELLPAFDILCLTSRTEGTPIVILEAVSAGVPIVAFSVGGIPALLDETSAWLVPLGDVEAFSRAVDDALASSSERRSRAATARRNLSRLLDVDRWAGELQRVYSFAGASTDTTKRSDTRGL